MKTVLISTSSLWNCGDDFIRMGVLELLQLKPDVRVLWWNRGYGVTDTYANDLSTNLRLMDYFIIAGTPQWIYKNIRIYKYCLEHQIPLSIIGVGTRNLGRHHQKLMAQVADSRLCEVAFARDEMASSMLKEFGFQNVHPMLDPAFFVPPLDDKKSLNILGWRKQYWHNSADYGLSFYLRYPKSLLNLKYSRLEKKKNEERRSEYDKLMIEIFANMPAPKMVVVHDNREVEEAENLFGSEYVFYSTDCMEILKRYSQSCQYIGSRIHGAIPSIVHGASAHLIYTSKKAQVMEQSVSILSDYSQELSRVIKVDYFGEDEIAAGDLGGHEKQASSKEKLHIVLNEEKQRIRKLLKEQPVLSSFILS